METSSTPLRFAAPSTARRIKPTRIRSWPNYQGSMAFPAPLSMADKENCAPEEYSQRRHAVLDSENDTRQRPGRNSCQADAKYVEGPCNIGSQKLVSTGDVQEAVEQATTLHIRTQSLEPATIPPSKRWWTMKAISRSVIFVVIRKLIDAQLGKNCSACKSAAQQSLEFHSCLKRDKKILSKYVREICCKICFKNLIHMIIVVSYSLNHMILTKKGIDCILNTVLILSKSEHAIDVLKALLKPSDKSILKYVETVIKQRHLLMICKE